MSVNRIHSDDLEVSFIGYWDRIDTGPGILIEESFEIAADGPLYYIRRQLKANDDIDVWDGKLLHIQSIPTDPNSASSMRSRPHGEKSQQSSRWWAWDLSGKSIPGERIAGRSTRYYKILSDAGELGGIREVWLDSEYDVVLRVRRTSLTRKAYAAAKKNQIKLEDCSDEVKVISEKVCTEIKFGPVDSNYFVKPDDA